MLLVFKSSVQGRNEEMKIGGKIPRVSIERNVLEHLEYSVHTEESSTDNVREKERSHRFPHLNFEKRRSLFGNDFSLLSCAHLLFARLPLLRASTLCN